MKQIIISSLLILTLSISNAQGIEFESTLSWKETQQKAKEKNKYILVDAFATWCIPCKEMDITTFSKKEVGDYINANFIAVKVQMDRDKSDNELVKSWYKDARNISEQYEVTAFPTLLIFNNLSQLVGKIVGFRNHSEFVRETRQIVERTQVFDSKYKAYLSGQNDSAVSMELVEEAKKAERTELAHEISQKYINNLSENELFQPGNLLFVYINTSKSTDRGFSIFRHQSKRADEILGAKFKQPSKKLVDRIIYNEEIKPYTEIANPNWKKIRQRIKKKYENLDDEYYYGVRMNHALQYKLWEEFGKYYALYYSTAYSHSAYHMNNLAWEIFEHVSDKEVLKTAINAMEYNNEHFDINDPRSIDTYANLLYKAGRINEAIQTQTKAVALSNNDKSLIETLNKMRRGEKTWEE